MLYPNKISLFQCICTCRGSLNHTIPHNICCSCVSRRCAHIPRVLNEIVLFLRAGTYHNAGMSYVFQFLLRISFPWIHYMRLVPIYPFHLQMIFPDPPVFVLLHKVPILHFFYYFLIYYWICDLLAWVGSSFKMYWPSVTTRPENRCFNSISVNFAIMYISSCGVLFATLSLDLYLLCWVKVCGVYTPSDLVHIFSAPSLVAHEC